MLRALANPRVLLLVILLLFAINYFMDTGSSQGVVVRPAGNSFKDGGLTSSTLLQRREGESAQRSPV